MSEQSLKEFTFTLDTKEQMELMLIILYTALDVINHKDSDFVKEECPVGWQDLFDEIPKVINLIDFMSCDIFNCVKRFSYTLYNDQIFIFSIIVATASSIMMTEKKEFVELNLPIGWQEIFSSGQKKKAMERLTDALLDRMAYAEEQGIL